MRSPAETRSHLLARAAVIALIAAAAPGCTTDVGRFTDNPFSGSMAARSAPSGEVTGSVPSGRVDSQPLPAPSRPANVSSTGVSGGGGMASYQPPASPPATRLVGASAPIKPAPAASSGKAGPAGGVHVVAPGETLISVARLYGKTRAEVAKANNIDGYANVRVGQRLVIPGVHQAKTKPSAPVPQLAAKPASQTIAAAPLAAPAPAQQRAAAVPPTATARLATPAAETPPEAKPSATSELTGAVPTFRWPVRGRVIAGLNQCRQSFFTQPRGAGRDLGESGRRRRRRLCGQRA